MTNHLDNITPVVLCFNEAPNIARTLTALNWAQEIVVIDSYSTDETLEIIAQFQQVKLYQRKFDTHAQQWNFGLEHVKTEWALSLDADYVLSTELTQELSTWKPVSNFVGYFIPFKYCVFGKPLHGTILPPRQALFLVNKARYVDDGHTQLLEVGGQSGLFKHFILHDDRKSLSRWLWAQDRYAQLELAKFQSSTASPTRFNDWVRKQIMLAPFVVFFYCLILKGGILDGWRGWYYAFQRMLAELLLSLHLLEARINRETKK
ncbi:MAG: glycosyltransferase family 2 protein [Haliscomenobacter sp.]|uniref:glycosyltransferase family 2 protein n=1 Tax=Haliscomenobacter sp. TaxID=2717303 RepID=UPI0029BBA410|nr:glycosyltransferase family 2 protein [Haliscomenobacter sp.]MDX2067874.1 glycosyltransferase family 2 protein [Haliscomenobacter sp.]